MKAPALRTMTILNPLMRLLWSLPCIFACNACFGITFLSYDPDSMATGGAGAVTGSAGAQPFLNPSTFQIDGSCCVASTYAGVRAIDRQHFLATAEELRHSKAEAQLEQRLRAVRSGFEADQPDPIALRELGATADLLISELDKLPHKPLRVSASAGAYAVGQTNSVAAGAFSRRYLVLGAIIENDPEDRVRIQRLQAMAYSAADVVESLQQVETVGRDIDWRAIERLAISSLENDSLDPQLRDYESIQGMEPLIAALRQLKQDLKKLDEHVDLRRLLHNLLQRYSDAESEAEPPEPINLREYLRHPIPRHINSHIVYSGAEIEETGLNLSTVLPRIPALTLGVNFKEVTFSTIAFTQRLDQFDLQQYQEPSTHIDYQFWNLDLGFRYDLSHHWKLGGVVRNIRRIRMETVLGDDVYVRPVARLGVAYHGSVLLLALDADLTKNEPLGFDPDKQYVSVGAQVRYWRKNSLRFGYRYDFVDRSGLPSAGLGFEFYHITLDLAATYSPANDEAGASLQMGLRF